MKIPEFKDTFISDKDIYYYPQSVSKNYKSNIIFNKTVTIQWRKVWPKGRKGQQRILGNGQELAEKLAAILSISEQISIMRKTDYLIGIHGAGLCLSIFMPHESIVQEVNPRKYISVVTLMSALSGHKTYSDIIKSEIRHDEDLEKVYFDPTDFANNVKKHMEENDFFK